MSDNCKPIKDRPSGTIECDSLCPIDLDKKAKDCLEIINIRGVTPPDTVENLLAPDDQLWTEVFLPEILCIPEKKPDVEQILSVIVQVKIISKRVVETPVLIEGNIDVPIENQEGIFTTGRKLVIEGVLKQKVVYTADVKEQSVHASHFDVPFSAFIILEPDTPLIRNYCVEAAIEDIFICMVSKRQLFKNVTLFLKATPAECVTT